MRLTNTLLKAFVRAVMDYVPSTDYQEQAIELLSKAAEENLPPALKRAISIDPSVRDWIESRYHHVGKFPLSGTYLLGTREALDQLGKDEALQQKLQTLSDALAEQNKCRNQLQAKIEGIAASCTSRKQLLEALPEFEKYLPAQTSVNSRSVPALANLLADLTAAGWPKQGKASGSDAATDALCQESLGTPSTGLLVCAHEHEEKKEMEEVPA